MVACSITSRALLGMHAPAVTVETHLPGGLPGFTLVGLPEAVVREARDRVKSAIQNCGYQFPRGRVVVNLAPADLAKEGARYDLPIAVSILCATQQLKHHQAKQFEFVGELSLYGDVRPVRGILSALQAVDPRSPGRRLVMPQDNANELLGTLEPSPLLLNHLSQLPDLVKEPEKFAYQSVEARALAAPDNLTTERSGASRLDSVIGQQAAKRALIIAAAGGHHLLMVGPPGSGKTLLARCLRNLLPQLAPAQAMAVAAIHSVAGKVTQPGQAPFREPHHSATAPAMAGGGSKGTITPGEISLAHLGVLFLDELPHFKPSVLDLLREPLSNGYISISRAHQDTRFPARFQLLCAMNPCPAGLTCSTEDCRCTPTKVRQYQSRVSGPLLDRIDLQINVPALTPQELLANQALKVTSEAIEHTLAEQQIAAAQKRAMSRQGCLNADHIAPQPDPGPNPESQLLLEQALSQLQLSARGYHRVLRVAQTIADLDELEGSTIEPQHLAEALAYRKVNWGTLAR